MQGHSGRKLAAFGGWDLVGMEGSWLIGSFIALLVWLSTLANASANPLVQCAEHFIDGDLAHAPTLFSSLPEAPYDSNIHLCYRVDDTSFFAVEYWPERFAPRWVAYQLSGEPFGPDGCNTYTRAMANCYLQRDEWIEPFDCPSTSDPFHRDHLITSDSLDTNAFVNSGHDRGHIAARQFFSWHVCGAYQSFTMVNMSPQSASLNQGIWADLESQVLTWAVDHGPIHVVSGTLFRFFPHWRFSVYGEGALDSDEIYPPGSTLESIATRMRENVDTHPSGHILRPRRAPNPERLDDTGRDVAVPTGYYKVIYRPAIEDEPAQAIGFLLPHSFERLRWLADHYEGLERADAFWAFVSRIDLIEEMSGVRFPGISDEEKAQWRNPWFFERRGSRTIRSSDCGVGTPAGVLENTSSEDRLAACRPIGVDGS